MSDQLRAEMMQRAELFRELANRFGAGVLDVVAMNTSRRAQNAMESATLVSRDLAAVMSELWNELDEIITYQIVEQSPDVLKLRVSACVFADVMRTLDASDIGLAFYCAYDEGFCRGLNPSIRFSRTKTLMAGDDCCNHSYELGTGGSR